MSRAKSRPLELTEEQKFTAINMAIEGQNLKSICNAILVTQWQFWDYKNRTPEFNNIFESARQEGVETMVDDIQVIADQEPDVLRARLKSENIRWIASKRKAHVYGDKLDLNITQVVDVGMALKEAKQRVAPKLQQSQAIDAEWERSPEFENALELPIKKTE